MDDLSARLAEILNDPESMARVREMAKGILGEGGTPNAETPFANTSLDPEQISQVMQIVSLLGQDSPDSRADLLLALKPHLGERRRRKVDTAVKLLKLVSLLPLLKESGILTV